MARREHLPSVNGVPLSTAERILYPEINFTKADLAQLYAALAPWMLPYIARRPLTLVRCEGGVSGEDALRARCRFLPHEAGWYRWAKAPLRQVAIAEQHKTGTYLVVDSAEALVSLAQGDIVEVHCWSSSVDQLEQPDRLIFDLDPGAGVPWRHTVEAAWLLHDELAKLGLACWPKLTGGKGVHVVLPFQPAHGWDAMYTLARKIAEAVAQKSALFTLEFSKQRRRGKVLIDYKRNHRAAVAVAAYSPRARPNGNIGVPISWTELKPALRADRWTVRNVLRRLRRLEQDPWADFWTCRQRIG